MKRKIIKIDETTCNGCGACIPNCPEGAIQVIDGKARLISDRFCDGLGACLGQCPLGAIAVEEREAEPYDERKVMENIVRQGPNVVEAHLAHLKGHGEKALLAEALQFLEEKGMRPSPADEHAGHRHTAHAGCPGSRSVDFARKSPAGAGKAVPVPSELTHWPVQLHLMSPSAPQYHGQDVVIAADCVAYAMGDFHGKHLKGKALAIACPKLDSGLEEYEEKIRALIDEAQIGTLTVLTMEVPCCGGLLRLVKRAAARATRAIPITSVVVGIQGDVLSDGPA